MGIPCTSSNDTGKMLRIISDPLNIPTGSETDRQKSFMKNREMVFILLISHTVIIDSYHYRAIRVKSQLESTFTFSSVQKTAHGGDWQHI